MILIISAALLLIAYLSVIVFLYGWLQSWSDSYYKLPQNMNWIFSSVLWAVALLIMIAGGTNLIFLAGMCLMLVGGVPRFKEEQSKAHYVFAISSIGFGMLSLIFDFHLGWLVGIAGIVCLALKLLDVKNVFWWIECVSFTTMLIGLSIPRLI